MDNEPRSDSQSDLNGEVVRLLREILNRLEPAPELLTVKDLAALLNISPAQLYKMMESP